MNTTANTLIALGVIIVLGVLYVAYIAPGGAPPVGTDTSMITGTIASTAESGASAIGMNTGSTTGQMVTIHYTAQGFEPSTVTINQGDTVDFIADAGSGSMWVASDPHPTHEGYDGTVRSVHCVQAYTGPEPFDECMSGTAYLFTFAKPGTWGYHNHLDEGMTGTVIVQ